MSDIKRDVIQHLSQTMRLSDEAAGRILVKVRETLNRDFDALELCLRQGDCQALPSRLHKLKGDLSNLGLPQLAAQAHERQRGGEGGSAGEMLRWVEGLRRTLTPLLTP